MVHLPIEWPLKEGEEPWCLGWQHGEERISVEEGCLRYNMVKDCHGLKSGCAFRANPNMSLPADAATLNYSVWFPADFNWVKGGKLPGLNIGCEPNDCSTGGEWSLTGGSFRIMFREGGAAIGYFYAPLPGAGPGAFECQCPAFQEVSKVKGEAGIDMWHSRSEDDCFLKAGEWNTISIGVKLNTPGQSDGSAIITVNGKKKTQDGILWRLNDTSRVNAVNFVAFFGGGSDDWNSPVDTYCLFKDVYFHVEA